MLQFQHVQLDRDVGETDNNVTLNTTEDQILLIFHKNEFPHYFFSFSFFNIYIHTQIYLRTMTFSWSSVDPWKAQVLFSSDPETLTKFCLTQLWRFSKNLTFQKHLLLLQKMHRIPPTGYKDFTTHIFYLLVRGFWTCLRPLQISQNVWTGAEGENKTDVNYFSNTYSKVGLYLAKAVESIDETYPSTQHWQQEIISTNSTVQKVLCLHHTIFRGITGSHFHYLMYNTILSVHFCLLVMTISLYSQAPDNLSGEDLRDTLVGKVQYFKE